MNLILVAGHVAAFFVPATIRPCGWCWSGCAASCWAAPAAALHPYSAGRPIWRVEAGDALFGMSFAFNQFFVKLAWAVAGALISGVLVLVSYKAGGGQPDAPVAHRHPPVVDHHPRFDAPGTGLCDFPPDPEPRHHRAHDRRARRMTLIPEPRSMTQKPRRSASVLIAMLLGSVVRCQHLRRRRSPSTSPATPARFTAVRRARSMVCTTRGCRIPTWSRGSASHRLDQGAGRAAASRCRRSGGFDPAHRCVGRRHLYLHDRHQPRIPYDWKTGDCAQSVTNYIEKLRAQVRQVKGMAPRYRDRIVFVPYNEPDGNMFAEGPKSCNNMRWQKDPTAFNDAWDRAVRMIRQELPGARIAGPNTSILYPEVRASCATPSPPTPCRTSSPGTNSATRRRCGPACASIANGRTGCSRAPSGRVATCR